MGKQELQRILEKHAKWLYSEEGGERANLRGANLRGADFRGANLRGANLRCANLRDANLSGANLRDANLPGADFRGANLRDASLRCANLLGANLSGANLNLADLRDASLRGANLSLANLSLTDLRDASLSGASLRGANLSGAEANWYTSGFWIVCPESGSFTAWANKSGHIIELLIPEHANRSSSTTRKCRASEAIVVKIHTDGANRIEHDAYNKTTIYKEGDTVFPDSWDKDRWNECSHGIHFFMSRKEAEIY